MRTVLLVFCVVLCFCALFVLPPVFCVPNVASVSGLSILDYPLGFLECLFNTHLFVIKQQYKFNIFLSM